MLSLERSMKWKSKNQRKRETIPNFSNDNEEFQLLLKTTTCTFDQTQNFYDII